MLARRNFNVQSDNLCVLCNDGEVETIKRLFFDCCFARRCWNKLEIVWGVATHMKITQSRRIANVPFFMEIFLVYMGNLEDQKQLGV